MSASTAHVLFLVCVFLWGAIRAPHELRNKRKNKITVSRVDLRERALLSISLVGLGLLPGAYAISALWRDGRGILSSLDWGFSPLVATIGFLVFLAALALFLATHRQLKRNWSQTLELREDHTLVTHGVYTLVRHPMYTAFFMWAVAQALMLQNWVAGLCGLVGFGLLYAFRVGREEDMMRAAFGQQWDDYARRTKRLIPYLH